MRLLCFLDSAAHSVQCAGLELLGSQLGMLDRAATGELTELVALRDSKVPSCCIACSGVMYCAGHLLGAGRVRRTGAWGCTGGRGEVGGPGRGPIAARRGASMAQSCSFGACLSPMRADATQDIPVLGLSLQVTCRAPSRSPQIPYRNISGRLPLWPCCCVWSSGVSLTAGATMQVKGYVLSALAKVHAQARLPLGEGFEQLLHDAASSHDADLQLRAVQIQAVFE